jgi:hypothetical protein
MSDIRPTPAEQYALFDACEEMYREQEQREDDLVDLERIVDEIHDLQFRLERLMHDRKKLERQLGFP